MNTETIVNDSENPAQKRPAKSKPRFKAEMLADMEVDGFAQFAFGKLALEKMKPVSKDFRLDCARWIRPKGNVDKPKEMEITGADFRVALSGVNKGRRTIRVPHTTKVVRVLESDMRALEAEEKKLSQQ